MGHADYEVQQHVWVVLGGLLKSVVWTQTLSVALIFACITLVAACCRKSVNRTTALYIAVFFSFFLWPQMYGVYLSITDPKDFGPVSVLGLSRFTSPIAGLWVELLALPVLMNGLGIFVAGVAPVMWLATRSFSGSKPWTVMSSAALLLPLAWVADFFNEGPH